MTSRTQESAALPLQLYCNRLKIWEGPRCKASLVISVEWVRMCYPPGTNMWQNIAIWGSPPKLQFSEFLLVFHYVSMTDWIIGPSVELSLSPPLSLGSEPQLSNPVNRSSVASPHLESSSSHQFCRVFTVSYLSNINCQYPVFLSLPRI